MLNMTLALSFIANSGSEADWSRLLTIAWLVIVLTLSIVEVKEIKVEEHKQYQY